METSIRSPTSEPAFHADDTEQVADYRTVSALAIVSLLFGLASPLCFAAPIFMAIPLFGAAISILALRRIEASEGALAGRWAATIGLALCVVSATTAVSRDLVTQYIRARQAKELGQSWIALLLAGNTEQAFQLTAAGNRRQPPPEPGAPSQAPAATPYELFVEHPIVPLLAASGAGSEIRFAKTVAFEPQPRGQFFIQQMFLVAPSKAAITSEKEPIEVILTIQRSHLTGEPQPRWLVANYESPQATATSSQVH